MPTALVPLFEGFEEIEAVTIIDVLRRANIEVITASLNTNMVIGAHAIAITADKLLDEVDSHEFDAIILAGGAGTFRLREDTRIAALLKAYADTNKLIGAICAAPTVLSNAGLRDVQLRIKNQPSLQTAKDEENVG